MKEFNGKGRINGTVFNKAKLMRLEDLLSETSGVPLKLSKSDISYNEGTMNLGSFNELSLEDTTGFSKNPYRVSMSASGYANDKEEENIFAQRPRAKSVRIDIWKDHVEFNVYGTDKTWVLGKREQLKEFFKTCKNINFVNLSINVVGAIIMLFLAYNLFNSELENIVDAGMLYLLGAVLVIALQIYYARNKPSQILLKEREPSTVDSNLIVTVVGIIVTSAIAVAIAIWDK